MIFDAYGYPSMTDEEIKAVARQVRDLMSRIDENYRSDPIPGPVDAPNNQARETVDNIRQGKIAHSVRKVLREALDVADRPLSGRAKHDAAIGRISRMWK